MISKSLLDSASRKIYQLACVLLPLAISLLLLGDGSHAHGMIE
jgi:hypothetical protein